MTQANPPDSTVWFGVFEVDLNSGELRKSGVRIRLQEQPFRVLMALLERPGELVTREELRRRVWPTESSGDFDHAVNIAVGKLRAALGDSADAPRYVETLHRRGYRFVFPVVPGNGHESIVPVESGLPSLSGENTESHKSFESSQAGSRIRWIWGLVAVFVILIALVSRLWFGIKTRRLTDRDTIVLADFVNTTGDSVFDGALKEALGVELEQSPFLNVLSDQKVGETLTLMKRPVSEHINQTIGREICLRTGSKAEVVGTISAVGSRYLIDIKAVACSTGDNLAQEQAEAKDKDEVLHTLSAACSRLRTALGESLPSVQRFDVPVEATTSSLEALRSYSLGIAIKREKGDSPSIPFFKHAIEVDPNFALAYAELAETYTHLYQSSFGLEAAAKAYELRDKVTEREKLRISANYFLSKRDLEGEAQTYELWSANYPRDFVPHVNLSANYMSMGQYDKALTEAQEALRLGPDNVANYSNLAFNYFLLDRLDEAKSTIDRALAHNLDGRELHWDIYEVGFLRGDEVQMEQQLAWAAGKPAIEDTLLYAQSSTEAYYGRLKRAREFNQRAVDSSLRADSAERAGLWLANSARWEGELGKAASARRDVAAALALSKGRYVKMLAALVLAGVGNVSQAQALAAELEKTDPTYTMLKVLWLPTIKAATELAEDNPSKALMHLETAAPYELSNNLNLLPAYLRGQAYLQEHDGSRAVAEFQKVIDHRGIVRNSVPGALVSLQIGRAYSMEGNVPKARAAYQDFVTLWKDADPDIPILKQAKAEYARLR